MLITEHEKYHKMTPKDVGLKEAMIINIARTTTATGEQFHFQVPVYPDDSREMVNDRVKFCFSFMQDRMEDENIAVDRLNKARQESTMLKVSIDNNNKLFVKQMNALKKRLRKGQIEASDFDLEVKKLQDGLVTANAELNKKLEDAGEKYTPHLPDESSVEDTEDLNPEA